MLARITVGCRPRFGGQSIGMGSHCRRNSHGSTTIWQSPQPSGLVACTVASVGGAIAAAVPSSELAPTLATVARLSAENASTPSSERRSIFPPLLLRAGERGPPARAHPYQRHYTPGQAPFERGEPRCSSSSAAARALAARRDERAPRARA